MSDLTTEDEGHVRDAVRFLHARCGGWAPLAKALHFEAVYLRKVATGRPVSASLAFRVARLAGIGLDDLLAGKYPPAGTCPHCGHREEVAEAAT